MGKTELGIFFNMLAVPGNRKRTIALKDDDFAGQCHGGKDAS
jgi:hypothetical protein